MDKEGYLVKKVLILGVTILVTISMAVPMQSQAKEKTLGQLRAEAKANRDAYNAAKEQKEMTEQERNETTKQKQEVEAQISQIQKEVTETSDKIVELQKDIDKKDEQMKDIMSFVQVTDGENNYLEYIFGATSFTDFIYRISVAEQLGDYNEQLVKEYESDVKELDEKREELNNKNTELSKKENELSQLEAKLNGEIEELQEGMMSKDDEYETLNSLIKNLEGLGCSSGDTMTSCQRKLAQSTPSGSGGGSVDTSGTPGANGTYMPIKKGRVTSDYGYRSYDNSFHTGIDFSNSVHGDSVYPVASGKVVNITYPKSPKACGNHIVYVYHNIGKGYTTSYWHMTSVNVSVGQTVYPDTRLGSMGGLPSEDSCAGGTHVHLNLFNGLHTTNSGRIDPRILVSNIPRKGTYFTSYYGNR